MSAPRRLAYSALAGFAIGMVFIALGVVSRWCWALFMFGWHGMSP